MFFTKKLAKVFLFATIMVFLVIPATASGVAALGLTDKAFEDSTIYYYEPDKGNTESATGDNYHVVINGDGNNVVIGGNQNAEEGASREPETAEIASSKDADSERRFSFALMVLGGIVLLLMFAYVIMRVLDYFSPYDGFFGEILEMILALLQDFFDWLETVLSILFGY